MFLAKSIFRNGMFLAALGWRAVDCCEMVDGFALPRFFSEIHEMEGGEFFYEFNYLAARQLSFCAEARQRAERNIVLKRRFMSLHGRLAD